MDFHGAFLREQVEHIIGQGGSAVLDRAAHAEFLPGQFGKFFQGIEIELDFGDGAVRQNDAAVGGPGLDADFGNAFHPGGQVFAVGLHVGA